MSEEGKVDSASILHSLIVSHRLTDKQFSVWVKDSLVKQGQTTAKAEGLLKSMTCTVNTFNYDLRALKQLLRSMDRAKKGQFVGQDKMATFFELVALDAASVQLHLALDKARTNNDQDFKDHIGNTVQVILPLLEHLAVMAKSAIIHNVKAEMNEESKQILLQYLSISGTS